MRTRARKDDNHQSIIKTFRKLGVSVADTSQLGGGFPDIVVGLRGVNVLVEIKDGKKPPSARKLTPAETAFSESWGGWYAVVENDDDVLRVYNEIARK